MSQENFEEKNIQPDVTIDAKGVNSPIPLLRLKKELAAMPPNTIFQIDCTDSGCDSDFDNWCTRQAHTFIGKKSNTDFTSYFIKK